MSKEYFLKKIAQSSPNANTTKPATTTVNTSFNSNGASGNTAWNPTNFSSGNIPSYRDVLGRLTEVYEQDQNQGIMYASQFETLMHDKSSPYYRTYAQPTNRAVEKLNEFGIDTAGLNDDFYAQNESWILDNLIYNGTGESPTKPTKKSSQQQHIAYWMYQYYKDEGQTKKAEQEYEQALEEARYWGWRSDRNLSDDEIIAKVRENFSAKYPTLAQMEKKDAMAPFSLNRAVDFSDDALIGAAWMGRNGEFDGTLEQAMAYSALGRGATYERNDEIAAKLDPNSEKYDGGYSLGSTNLDDAAFHFRVSGFNKQWLDDHKDIPLTGSEEDKKMYAKVVEAYNNQTQGQEELDKLIEFVETKAQFCSSPEDVLKKINWSDYKILSAMDKSIGQNGNYATGNLVPLTEGLAYTYNGLTDYVNQLFEYKSQKRTCDMFIGQITSAIDNTIPALVQQTAEQEAAQQEEAAKIASHSTYRPTAEITETAKAIAAEKDRKTAESAEMTFGVDNDEEKAVNQNQRSAFYDQTVATLSDMKAGGYVDYTVRALAPTLKTSTIKQYSKSVLTGFDTVQAYEQNEKRIEELQEMKDTLGAELGDLIHAGREYQDNDVVPITVNGKVYDLHISGGNREVYNEETDEFDNVADYFPVRVTEHGNFDSPQEDITGSEEYQQAVQAAIDEANKGRTAWDAAQGAGLTEEQQAKVEQYWQASNALDNALKTRQDTEEDYQTSKKNIEEAKALQANRIALFKQAGLDTRAMEESAVVTDFFLDFTKYDPTGWGSYNFYHPLSEMLTNGDVTADEAFQVAETGDAEIQQAMDVARTMLEYADENGIELPDSVRENVLRYIDSLETQHQDFEYMSMMRNEDFESGASEGRSIADGLIPVDSETFNAELSIGKTCKEILEEQPTWDKLTKEQQDALLLIADRVDSDPSVDSGNPLPDVYGVEDILNTYNSYLSAMKIEDQLYGSFPSTTRLGDIMTDYELDTYYYLLGTQGIDAAQEYSDHIRLDGGVLNSRLREQTEGKARDLADQGFWGRRAADVLSMLLSPVAAAQSFAYSVNYGMRKLTGERVEWNPNSADLSANIYKKAAREEIQSQIQKTYEGNPVLQKFMSGLQEIISNRGDSIVNGLITGPLFQGIGNEILQELFSAMPMAVAAATDAVSEAKENGASDDLNLLGIYATNLLFEAGTEAVSLSNIKDALNLGEDLTTDGLKAWVTNWLTQAGVSEMVGETVTDIAEKVADGVFLGENSEYARAVDQYKANGMTEDQAKAQAANDQVMQVLHTALISYLSPGADIGSYAVGRYKGYRAEARAQQLAGNNVSVMDVYRAYKQQRQEAEAQANAPTAQAASGQEAGVAMPENTQEVAAPEPVAVMPEKPVFNAEAEAKRRAEDLTLDIEILETAATGDPSVQTASIAAVLNTDRTDESFDVSNAAAVHMNALFAGGISPSESVQNLMLGANVSDVSVTDLKHALETAALSPNSEAYKVMQSEEYQNADPAERAEMLAATVEADANNATVQSDISKAVHDNRVARAENDVMDAPEVKGAYEKAYNAQGDLLAAQEATQQAQEQLDSYESELDAKRDALRTAGDEMANDASDATRVDMVNRAIADLQKTSAVVEEYRQHLTKAQQKEQEAEEIASRTLQEYQNTKRTLAERLVNEQDQQRSEAQAQAEAQAVIDEAKAQAQAEQEAAEAQAQEEEDNAVLLDAEAFIEQQEAANGPLTEEEKQKIRDMFVARNAVKEEQGAGNTAQNAGQAEQQEGQQATSTVRPNLDKVRSRIANKFGMNIEFRDTMEDGKTLPNGQKFRKNGYYDKATNTIILDSKNATVNDMMYFVLGHELTHVAEQSGKYNDLANSIMRIFYGDNADYQGVLDQLNSGNINSQIARDVAAKKAIYDRQLGGVHSNEEILQEVVADRMGQILYGENEEQRADYINRLCKEDISTARRIVESIKNFLKQVVGMKGAWVSDMQKTVDLFETALKDAQSAKAFKENSKAEAQPVDVAQQPVTGAENAMSGEEFQNTLKNTGLSIPEYKITDGWYGNQPTIRFESAPDQIVTEALENIGMVPGKDALTFKTPKGKKIHDAQITWALKKSALRDAGGKTVTEQNANVQYSMPEESEQNAFAENDDIQSAVENQDIPVVGVKPANREEKLQLLRDIRNSSIDYEAGAYRLETIPEIYTQLFDVGDLDLTISPRHSYNIMATADEAKAEGMFRKGYGDHYHGLGPEGYMEAIDALDDPSVIINATGKGKKANPRIAMVIDTKTNGPLLAVIDFYSNQKVVDDDGKRTHALLTIYDKDNIDEYVKNANESGKVMHLNEKQGGFGATVQFGSDQSSPALDDNLTQFNDYVKRWKENRDIRYSLPSDDILDQQIAEFMNRRNTQAQPSNPSNSRMGIRQWGNEGAQRSDELDARAKAYVLNSPYAKDTNAAELARALEWVRGNKQYADDDGFQTSLRQVTSKRFNYRTKDGQAKMVAVMALAAAKGDVQAQVDLADAYNKQGTDLGQALQARKLFRLMTPEGRIASLRKMLGNVQEQTGNDDIKLSDWIYEAASQATDENEFLKIQKAAAAELAEQIPGNWKDKLRGLRMLSMLGNPRTHIRNIVGNALFVPAVSLKNKMGAVAEMAFNTGERTKTLKLVLPKEIKDFCNQDADFMKDELTGEAKYNEGNMVQKEMKPFTGLMQKFIDANGGFLEKEDWLFLKGHYKRALGGWIDANGYTIDQLKSDPSLLDKGRAYAIQEAQKATYRDFNGVASWLNNPTVGGKDLKGVRLFVDAVLPFKKTPMNILKRGVEYSPIGFLRGLKNAALDVKSGKITANEAIDRICSGLSGMAVMAMGAFLGHIGAASCGFGDDDDEFEKAQGGQKYALNPGKALNKIFNAKLFGEDVTYTVDWAAPMSMPFFVGAAIMEQLHKEGDFDVNAVVNSLGNIAEPVFNLSMLDGVNTLFKTAQNDDTNAITQVLSKVGSNYVTSYVPSLLSSVARTVDKRRATFVKSGEGKGLTGTINYAIEQVENKIPGLSQGNIAQKDVFGREETDSLAERFIENFVSPGYISHLKNDPILNEMDRLYNANVIDSEDMVPSDPPKSFKYGENQYRLSAEEWDTFKTVRGQTAFGMLTELINSSEYKNADDAAQVQMIKKVWEYATQVGKNAVVPEYLVDGNTTVAEIAKDGKITSCYDNMLTSLKNGDYMGYETMVEALHQMDVEDSKIKEKIANKYRKSYQQAYISGDQYKMAEIEQILDMTDFSFDLNKWEEDAEKNYGKQ